MKHSIRKQFTSIFIILMAGTILLCWFINNFFLEEYYFYNKQHVVMDAYRQINSASQNGSVVSEDFDIYLQQICGRYNISVLVVDEDSETIRSAGADPAILKLELWNHILLDSLCASVAVETENGMPSAGSQNGDIEKSDGASNWNKRWDGNIYDKYNGKVLKESESPYYKVQVVKNSRLSMDYLDMWGFLDNGNLFIVRTALEGIRDSVEIANRFLAYVGIFAALMSGILMWFIARRITNPILELAGISERMSNLDFDARYRGRSYNEIAILGGHMNQLADTLEKTISELKTANNELQKDIDRKNEVDEMRKEFLSNVSHELKTPIALIQGYAEGLKEGINDDAESRDFYCDVIMDESAKMNTMVKKLLTLNQLEFGNEVVAMERFDIASLVRNFLQSADILVRQNEINIRFNDPGVVYVWGDEFKTEEVIMNYFSNALNHVDGERIVDVKLEPRGKVLRISVFNTGQSIPEDSLPHLWEKFYKVDKARTREYGGSGVGLSIVKAIMESMNQKFGVINYENGAEFWFELELVGEKLDENV